ncbi:SRPBCC family protein [Prosthecodimorpha staleyi]|uniref:SRPBCC family protein n=1 Tax=Prosthecodimorpha staleyi TaxID=2840188 RepID=A0A947D1E1_9HYPH|nr:SRPBCC family protein [Prosthecodimorpha staleyi]MBT9288985.1 SRPBCC family protein [Prosthecodimorpha staleyi]
MKHWTLTAIAAAAVALVAATADAHGPTRQKVTETIEINAPAAKVWAVIGNFQDMSWHPAVAKGEGKGGNEINATRTLTLQGGAVIPEETLEKYDAAGMNYSYRITKEDVKVLPVTNYTSRIAVTEEGGKAKVEWRGAFYRGFPNNDPPPELNDEAAIKAVKGVYSSGLEALKKKVESGS